jgi:hypothetical protein
MLNWLVEEKQITPHIPVIDKSKREEPSQLAPVLISTAARLHPPCGACCPLRCRWGDLPSGFCGSFGGEITDVFD